MGYKERMGMDLVKIENKLIENGYFVQARHHDFHYFTAENEKGVQVYCQVNSYGMGYDISSKYKTTKGEGTGRSIYNEVSFNILYDKIIDAFSISEGHSNRFGLAKSLNAL